MHGAVRTTAFLAVGLVAGFAIATWNQREADDRPVPAGEPEPIVNRIAALEQALRQESGRRGVLAAEVDELRLLLEAAAQSQGMAAVEARGLADAARERDETEGGGEDSSDAERRQRTTEQFRDGRPREGDIEQWRVERLVQAGFSADRAEWINRRTAELRMQELQDEYRAAREGEEFDPRTVISGDQALRSELGDADYERYLQAIGRPTSVGVRNVLASSPAEQAGLLPGDEVIAYGGERVFDVGDLNRLTLDGQPGETVALDVLRDGQQIQLYVPRGPIGIMGGGRFGRRP